MPPVRRRSAQMKKRRRLAQMAAYEAEEQRVSIRDKKRRETCTHPSPSAAKNTDVDLLSCGLDATELLNLVSDEDNPQIDQVVPRLVEFLTRDENPQLQYGVARVLKNIAAGTSKNTKVVIDCGAVPVFVKLLESSESGIREQVAWALGNIAGDSPGYRDIVLNCGALSPLLTLLKEEHTELSFLRIGTWALSNFLEGKPEVPLEQLESAIPVLSSLILTNDEVLLKEACWALLFLSHCGGDEIKSTMYEANLCPKLAKLYTYAPLSVLLPAIRTVTSIVEGIKTLDERALEALKLITYAHRSELSEGGCIFNEAELLLCFLSFRLGEIMDAMEKKKRDGKKFTILYG